MNSHFKKIGVQSQRSYIITNAEPTFRNDFLCTDLGWAVNVIIANKQNDYFLRWATTEYIGHS